MNSDKKILALSLSPLSMRARTVKKSNWKSASNFIFSENFIFSRTFYKKKKMGVNDKKILTLGLSSLAMRARAKKKLA